MMSALTVREALERMEPEPLDHIFPASWISANFDIWIGAEEDNHAWTQLLRARQAFDAATGVPKEKRAMALEELLIAEGSDWCWWYGPEHDSANRVEFDELYRSHLANVYRFLNLAPPEELSRPILRVTIPAELIEPSGAIEPYIDGEIGSFFEWLGAGRYRADERSGSMHGKKFLVKEVHFGSNGKNFYLRVDFHPGYEEELGGLEVRLNLQSLDQKATGGVVLTLAGSQAQVTGRKPENLDAECRFARVLEARVPLEGAGIREGAGLRFQFSLWQAGLPMDAVPHQGWIEMRTTNPAEMSS